MRILNNFHHSGSGHIKIINTEVINRMHVHILTKEDPIFNVMSDNNPNFFLQLLLLLINNIQKNFKHLLIEIPNNKQH